MADRSLLFSASSGSGARIACALIFTVASACTPKQQASDPVAPAAPVSAGSQAAPVSEGSPAASPAPTASDAQRKGRASLFVVHMMSDFDAFVKYFEEGAAERAKAGVKGHLLTKLDDGRAVVHLFADDVAVVEKTLRSPEMEKYLDRKGSPETSLLWLTRDVFVKIPPAPPAGKTYSLYLKLKTDDLPALESELLRGEAKFAEKGVVAYGLHQTTASDTAAIVHFMGTAKPELQALPETKEFRELLARTKSQVNSKALVGIDVGRGRPE